MPTRREMLAIGCGFAAAGLLNRTLAAQPGSSSAAAAAVNPMQLVNPEFRPRLQEMLKNSGGGSHPISASNLKQVREMSGKRALPPLPEPKVTERLIPGHAGAPKVRVYVVGNSPGAAKPAVLHIHGGGYIVGSAAGNLRDIQKLSTELDCVVVTVDYRLAPETHFPGSLNDNYVALYWLYKHAEELGVDTKRIAIKGESAGGGHAAALAIAARDRGQVPVCMQVLIYPMLDDRTGSTRPVPPFIGHYIWTPQDNRFGWTSLLGVPAGSARVPRNSVPARVEDLRGLPPAFIGVGSIDLFMKEDTTYAQRLMYSSIPTEMSVVPGGYHGFDIIVPEAGLSREFTRAWLAALGRAFGRKPAPAHGKDHHV
jgi:acetyl esterase/lipase